MSEDRPKLYVYVCPYCLKQHHPHVDHNLGMRRDVHCPHAQPGEEGIWNVAVLKLEVVPAAPIEPRPIPHDGCKRWITDGEEEGDDGRSRQCLKGRKDGICPDHGPTVPGSPVNSGERVRA